MTDLIAEFRGEANKRGASGDQITLEDRAALKVLAKGAQIVIDVGTYIGASAESLLIGSDGIVLTVDTYHGTEGEYTTKLAADEIMFRIARSRLGQFGDRVQFLCGKSLDAAKWIPDRFADLVFLDAAHDYDSVKADIRAWKPKIKPGGVLAGHDFENPPYSEGWKDLIHMDRGPDNLHYGVILAVGEEIQDLRLFDASTVWWTPV